jgi:hypothetical protein
MLHLLRRCPLVAALVFSPGCRPAHSQPARVQQPVPVWPPTINFVIPDKKFVTNACADIEQEAKFYPKPTAAEVPPEVQRAVEVDGVARCTISSVRL